MYSLQIRTRPGVNLLKWNLFNEINGDVSYFVRITHGLEAPPLQSIMEFNVNFYSISFESFKLEPMEI